MHTDVRTKKKAAFFQKPLLKALKDVKKFLAVVVVVYDCNITLHTRDDQSFEPIDEPRHLHIVFTACIPSFSLASQTITMKSSFGITENTDEVYVAGPTVGRGTMVMLSEDYCVGQIIGTTFYLFIPLQYEWLELYGNDIDNPFVIALCAVLESYLLLKIPCNNCHIHISR